MKTLFLLIFTLCNLFSFSQSLDLIPFANGLNKPVTIQNAGDDRLFVLELEGSIRILEGDGTLVSQPFLNIDDRVIDISGISEQGLLGLAFHPNYLSNGFFYVNYIDNNGDTVISRFSRSSLNTANKNSEVILLTINQPFPNHNGGFMAFGDDGYLYISSGDGGSGGDPQDNAQDLTSLLGKILRIDVDISEFGLNYGIPDDNPYASNTTVRNEIWAYGLRNPWRFSFDRLTGDMWIGDVGQGSIEEINLIGPNESGVNFGWRCYEGSSTFNLNDCPSSSTIKFPVGQYVQSGTNRCSVTGGYRYRGIEFPTLEGIYFFADYCSGEIGTLKFNGSSWDVNFNTLASGQNWSTFGESLTGEIYVASVSTGNIFKLVDSELLGIQDVTDPKIKVSPNPVSENLSIQFSHVFTGTIELEVLDIFGRSVIPLTSIFNEQTYRLSVANLITGLYFLRIKSPTQSESTIKFVKN